MTVSVSFSIVVVACNMRYLGSNNPILYIIGRKVPPTCSWISSTCYLTETFSEGKDDAKDRQTTPRNKHEKGEIHYSTQSLHDQDSTTHACELGGKYKLTCLLHLFYTVKTEIVHIAS